MKNFIYTFAFVISITGSAMAQTGTSVDSRAASVTREMSTKMNLNESEYIKLKALNKERFTKAAEISTMYSNDIAMRDMKLAEMQSSYDSQLNTFLSPKQLEAYAAFKESNASFTAFTPEEDIK